MLQIMGRSAASNFQTYHRVLHRAVWSPLTASRLLLRLLVAVFIPGGVVFCGLDDTIIPQLHVHRDSKGAPGSKATAAQPWRRYWLTRRHHGRS